MVMTEGAGGRQDVLERIARVKAEFEAVQAQLKACSCADEIESELPGGAGEVERLREAVDAMESASENYEKRKNSLDAKNARMLLEIHEYESLRSRLRQIVEEEKTLLAEQAQFSDDGVGADEATEAATDPSTVSTPPKASKSDEE